MEEAMSERAAQGSDTRQKMIRAAADLFHKQGVVATSPDQVIEASATGKGQFYHYFGSKEGLVHEVLRTHLDAIKAGKSPVDYDVDSWEDLERWFLAHLDLQKAFRMTRGCPFGTIGNEVTENDELIRQDLNLIFEVVRNKLAAFFIKEKAQGRLAEGVSEERMADYCLATVQGAMLMGKIKRESAVVEATIRMALASLKEMAVTIEKPSGREGD
jgi:TetR/AcrR family transcriptional regulator, transcriptional repressor for nem operon